MSNLTRVVAALVASLTLLVGVFAAVLVPEPRAGDVVRGGGTAVGPGQGVVVIGTQGIRWQDVTPEATPALWELVGQGAAVGGATTAVTSASGTCSAAGWLGISSGRSVITGDYVDDVWHCAGWESTVRGDGAVVEGHDQLAVLQSSSEYRPRLGVLAEALAGAGLCTTAVGPGAALALADTDGEVERYRGLDDVRTAPDEVFSCPLTVVDAGSAPYTRDEDEPMRGRIPVPADATSEGPDRASALRRVDQQVRSVLEAVPGDFTVIVVDVGNPAPARPSLGATLVPAGAGAADDGTASFRYLTSGATNWLGVVRVLDVPTTIVAALGVPRPADLTGAPLATGDPRPSDAGASVGQLADLSVRDLALRGTTTWFTGLPTVAALIVLGIVVLCLPRLRERFGAGSAVLRRWRGGLEAVLLVCAAMPAAVYLVGAVPWWRAAEPRLGLALGVLLAAVSVAGIMALVPRRPLWVTSTAVAGFTFALLTMDALAGTPLHHAAPLGSAPTLGGRYYGFGNPTYSVYVVAAVLTAVGVAILVARRWGRVAGAVAAALVGVVATVVDLWPSLGADVGGALVLLPVFAVVVLAVFGARVTWRPLVATGVVGVVVVGLVGVLDWRRPPGSRTHLGTFVQQVIDGTAVELLLRKGGYALGSLLAGPPAWLTVAILVWLVLALRGVAWVRGAWLRSACEAWPLLRPVLVSLLVAAVAGALVNDYGIRIAVQMLFAAVPLVALVVLRIPDAIGPGDSARRSVEPAVEP